MRKLWVGGAVVVWLAMACAPKREPASGAVTAAPAPQDDPKTCVDAPHEKPAHREAQESEKPSAGRIEPKVVQGIVRAGFGGPHGFRACYEAGLGRHADLAGRVTMRFVIGLDGKVSDARVADSTLPDCAVSRCVREAFGKLSFPEPNGGIVSVVYPIVFEPAQRAQ